MKKAVIKTIKNEIRYLNIGNNRSLPVAGIIGIYDLDETTVSKQMRDYLRKCEKNGIVISASTSLPKSIIQYDDGVRENIYFSSFTSAVLYKRLTENEIAE